MICVAGGSPYRWFKYPFGFMDRFMESLIIGMRLAGIKKVVYQAGSVQPYPEEKVAFSNKIWHFTLALYIGIAGNEKDNDDVITRLVDAKDLD